MFWETFLRLCKEADTSPKEAMRGMGIGYSTLRHWRGGGMPQERTLKKVADYFGLPLADIMREVDRDLPDEPGEFPLSKLEVRIIRATRRLSPEQQDFLMEMLESAVRRILIKTYGVDTEPQRPVEPESPPDNT